MPLFLSRYLFEPTELSLMIKVLGGVSFLLVLATSISLVFEKKAQDVKLGRVRLTQTKWTKKFHWIHTFYMNLAHFCQSKEKDHLIDTFFWGGLGLILGSGIFLLCMKQLILAIFFPIFLLKFLTHILELSTRHTIEEIEEQLPYAIDRFIRVSTKNDDIKKILYTTSLDLDDPLRSIFDNLAIKMSSGYKTDTLMELGNRYNNIWIWSFVFILIGYSTNTAKAETIESLRNLRVLLEGENMTQKNQTRARKYGVALNYTLITISFLGFLANVFFNPTGQQFFFSSLVGLICLFGGFGAIFITILVNVKMVKRK